MDARWKKVERVVAGWFGGQRVIDKDNYEDVSHPIFSIEVKSRNTLPRWLLAAVAQAKRNAPEGKRPLVVLHQNGNRHKDNLVVMSMSDFIEFLIEYLGAVDG